LALASEQEAHQFRGYLTAEVERNNSFRADQKVEIEESRDFRSQQRHALRQTEARQIQKILKEQGTLQIA
jgi:SPX domain protein involved in polyphosphate accumulation